MSGKPQPSPFQQLTPLEYILALHERGLLFKADPLAKLLLAETAAAEKIHRKDLKLIVDGEVEQSEGTKTAVVDVVALNKRIVDDTSTLARRLKRAGLANEVSAVLKKHQGTIAIAEAMIAVARQTTDKVAIELRGELASEARRLDEAEQRKAAGGHPSFEDAISKAARQCWIHTDTATHLLEALLLKHQLVDDPVYLSRPLVKSILRPTLESPPAPAPARKDRKKKQSATSEPAATPKPAPAS